jgi:hypothetical protein
MAIAVPLSTQHAGSLQVWLGNGIASHVPDGGVANIGFTT